MTGDGTIVPRGKVAAVAGGHDEALDGWDAAALGFPVRVREIDHHDVATAHEILTDVMAGQAAGSFELDIRYKGKRAAYWMQCLSPDVLEPRYFGLLSPAGELLGWFSLMFTVGHPTAASLGAVMRERWRGRGLGTAAVKHAIARKGTLLARPAEAAIATTKPDNGRMIAVLQRVGMLDLGTYTDKARSVSSRVFATSRIALGR